MFLADAVAAYVEGLTERQLDAPLLALLRHLGFQHVHLVHGPYEFGKDIVARRTDDGVDTQYCLQSKAGDLGAAEWRSLRLQIDAMRTGTVVHPGFDPDLPRRLVVATNGRLKGAAGVEFQDYDRYHRARGEAPTDLWDLDYLVPRFEAVLVEGVPAPDRARTLELFGRLAQGQGTRLDIAAYMHPAFDVGLSSTQRWGNVLTGAMLATVAAEHGREDLAAQIAFRLLRVAWENPPEPGVPDPGELTASRRIFRANATDLWDHVRTRDPVDLTTRSRTGFDLFVTHPVKAARLCEHLSLLAILAHGEGQPALADEIGTYIAAFAQASPGVSHLVSDEWAFSLIPTVALLTITGRHDVAAQILRETAVWLLDRLEHGRGLARAGEPADAAVRQLLGPAFPRIPISHEPAAYAFTVVLDLAHLCGFPDLHADLLNDLDAVGGMASIVIERPEGAEFIARLAYSADESLCATHYDISLAASAPAAAGAFFDCFATWATTRDRHLPGVLTGLLQTATRT